MIDSCYLIVFDTESSGLDISAHELIEVAAQVYDPVTLNKIPKDEGGWFHSFVRPKTPETADPRALAVNGYTLEFLDLQPEPTVVWPKFARWVKGFRKGKSSFDWPIAAGKNIRNFDLPFLTKTMSLYGPKKVKTELFNSYLQVDLDDDLYRWFGSSGEVSSLSMDVMREYFGLKREGAHSADKDVEEEGKLIIHFLKLIRDVRKNHSLRGFFL